MTLTGLQGGLSTKSHFHIVSSSRESPNLAHPPPLSGDVIRRTHVRGTSRLGSHAGTGTQLADPLYAPLITSRGVALSIFSKLAPIVFFIFHAHLPPYILPTTKPL